MFKNFTSIIFTLILCSFIFIPSISFASKIILENKAEIIYEGDSFKLSVFVDTEGESINAVETGLVFDPSLISFESWDGSNSDINFWIEEPNQTKRGMIHFSGITPGGIINNKAKVVDLNFKAKILVAEKNSLAVFSFIEPVLLVNDGRGTQTETEKTSLELSIFDNKSDFGDSSNLGLALVTIDKEPPEVFTPSIVSDDSLFNGKSFIVFLTQDKISGIDRYEIKEGGFDFFRKVESPYVLKNQSLTSKIYIKAIDKAGNERLVIVEPQNHYTRGYQSYLILGIIMLVCVLSFSIKPWQKKLRL